MQKPLQVFGTFQQILSSFLCFGKVNACFQGWSAFYWLREPGQWRVSSVWILSAHLYYRDFIITFWSELMKTWGFCFRNTGQSLIPKGLSRCSLFCETPSYTRLSEASKQYFLQPPLWLTGKQVQLSRISVTSFFMCLFHEVCGMFTGARAIWHLNIDKVLPCTFNTKPGVLVLTLL